MIIMKWTYTIFRFFIYEINEDIYINSVDELFNVSYKYAVIADKIIINSINSKEEKNLEDIRMSDILYIGDKSSIPRKYLFTLRTKKYLCNRVGVKLYYCICKNGDGIQKIKFQPSEKFVSKIIKCGGLKCDLKK